MQKRRHPVVAFGVLELRLQLGNFVGAGLVPGDHDVEQFAIDRQVLHLVHGARGELARRLVGERVARLGSAAADHTGGVLVLAQLDRAGDDPDHALVLVALLEQQAARIDFPNEHLAGDGREVFLLHAFQWRKPAQQRHVHWTTLT